MQKAAITPDAPPNGMEANADEKDPKDSPTTVKAEENKDETSSNKEPAEKTGMNSENSLLT